MLEAAEHVCAGPGIHETHVPSTLAGLASKSMIVISSGGDAVPRYAFLETVHVFASEQLKDAAEREIYRRRHLVYALEFAEQENRIREEAASRRELVHRRSNVHCPTVAKKPIGR